MLLNPPLLYSGETDNIKIWDLRNEGPVVNIPLQVLPFNFENRSGIFKMILNDNKLIIGSNGLMGIVEYDLRTLIPVYYPVHDYQILTVCQGKNVLNNLIATSGSTKAFNYEINVYQAQKLDSSVKFVPGHKGVINSIDIGHDCIASGAKDGSAIVLKFNKTKEVLRNQSKTIKIISVS